jgi:gliding-associated putative ABC transporter substrate-binding component GldG
MKQFFKKYQILTAVIGLIMVVLSSLLFSLRVDLTADKRFTLSPSTIDLLKEVDSAISIQIFLTGDLPADYKKLSIAAKDVLDEMNVYASNNLTIEFIKPGADIADETTRNKLYDSLAAMGVAFEKTAIESDNTEKTTSQLIIPSALIRYKANQTPIAIDLRSSKKIFKQYNVINDEPQEDIEATRNAAEALLENKFIVAIDKLTRKAVPVIAYAVGNGEPVDLSVNDLGESLRNDYRLVIVDLKKSYPNASLIQTLMIVKPTQTFTEEDLLKIDQYIMNGGNVIWFVDKLYAELDSLKRTAGQYTAFDRGLGLDELLFKYGVRINPDLLQDLNCSKIPLVVGKNPDGSIRMQRMPWPYYPFLTARTPNPIAQNIDRVLPIFPSSIDTVMAKGITKTILLATDTNSRRITSPAIVTLNSVEKEEDLYSFNKSFIPVAILLEGKFNSLFANRIPLSVIDSVQRFTGKPFLTSAVKPGKQIVVSDADIVTNAISNTTGPLPMGMLPLENYRFANREFVLNSIDYLSSDKQLFESRNKTVVLRLLDKQKVKEQKTTWQLINVLSPAMLILLVGLIFQWRRKEKYTI